MKISLKWLKQYLPKLSNDTGFISDALTQGGLEVEAVYEYSSVPGSLKGVVVGEVIECKPHPSADRLKLTRVHIGQAEPLSVVCGAPNVAAGQKVLVATVGTKLTFSSGEVVTIKKSKIRGEESEGMICAEDELGIGSSHDGIMILPSDAQPGNAAEKQLNIYRDSIFEIGITPNRSDALSHFGVARDLNACIRARGLDSELSSPATAPSLESSPDSEINIEIQTPHCIRYAGAVIKGIRVAESPVWLKDALSAIGLRPINNVVDITNYILHDIGQPLHAFDLKAVEGNKVIVREAKEGEKLVTLDGVERALFHGNMLICNASSPMCIAGVFGGALSGVKESSTDIFLESACFSSVSVRKTSKEHGLKTDASYRYERGTDPDAVMPALNRAVELIKQICGARVAFLVDDISNNTLTAAPISFSCQRLNQFVGQEIPAPEVKEILSNLGISILSEVGETLNLQVPLYKADVTREIDVFEEVLRVYGYNRIADKPFLSVPVQLQSTISGLPEMMRDFFSSAGFFEVMNLSMTSEKNLIKGKEDRAVRLSNPLSSELSVLRQSLLFGMLENSVHNRNRQNRNIRLFEIGRQYFKSLDGGFTEEPRLGLLCGGFTFEESWVAKPQDADFFFLKGVLESLALKLCLGNVTLRTHDTELGKTGVFEVKSGKHNDWVWRVAQVSAEVVQSFGLDGKFYYAEINIPFLIQIGAPLKPRFSELPRFPKVRRDLALIVDNAIEFRQMEELARKAENKLLAEVNLFDVYEGKNIPAGKKSYAISFVLSNNDATLNEAQIEKAMERILKSLRENLAAELRA